MSIEILLAIASFSISVGALFAVLYRNPKRATILSVILAALVVTSSATLYGVYSHGRLVKKVEREIISTLADETLTFDELYERLFYPPYVTVNEALDRAVEEGRIGHELLELRDRDGTVQAVRVYYVKAGVP